MLIRRFFGNQSWLSRVLLISVALLSTLGCDHRMPAQCQTQLQSFRHGRFLSPSMPRISKAIATSKPARSVNQLASLLSKITYRGAHTGARVHASQCASPLVVGISPIAQPFPSAGNQRRLGIVPPGRQRINFMHSRLDEEINSITVSRSKNFGRIRKGQSNGIDTCIRPSTEP